MGPTRSSPRVRRACIMALVSCGIVFCLAARAQPASTDSVQAYPTRAVRLVVASSPGSGVDIVARIMAQRLKEFIALAKARPGQLNYGAGGIGGSTHLAAEYFKSMTGINIVVVPYKGSGAAVTDLIAGQIHLMFANITAAVLHVKTGKLRALAASGSERSLALPQLPTVAEAGVPGYAVTSWFGLVVPARTPPEVIAKLNAVLTAAMNGRDRRERLAVEGAELAPGSPGEFRNHMAREIVIWAKVVKAVGLQ